MDGNNLQSHWLLRRHLPDLVLCAQDHTQKVHLEEALELRRICFGDCGNLSSHTCRVADPLSQFGYHEVGRLTYAA